MKRLWVVGCLSVLLAVPTTASEIGVGLGFWDTEQADSDNGFAVSFSLDVGETWNIDLRTSFFDGHGFVHPERRVDIEATPIDLGLSYEFNPSGKASPYVGAGVNYTLYKSSVFNTTIDEQEQSRIKDEPGWYVVGGFKTKPTERIGFFFEALYRQSKADVQGDGLAAFDRIAVDFAGAAAAAGLTFNW